MFYGKSEKSNSAAGGVAVAARTAGIRYARHVRHFYYGAATSALRASVLSPRFERLTPQ